MELNNERSGPQALVLYDRAVQYEVSSDGVAKPGGSTKLAFSQDGSLLALAPAGGSASYIFPAQGHRFTAPSAVFQPALQPKEGTSSTDSVTHLAWSSDGSRLAVGTQQGCLYITSRDGQPLMEWGPASSWGRREIIGLCFAGRSTPLLLTSNIVLLDPISPAESPMQLTSLKEYHQVVRCMTFVPATSELVVVGDDGTSRAARVCISAWISALPGKLELAWRAGATGGAGWLSWGRKLGYAGWEAHANPAGSCLAVSMPGQPPIVLDLKAARVGQAIVPVPWVPPDLPNGAVSAVAWWDDSSLAAISPDGLCIVSRIDVASNMLIPAAKPFAPGTSIACQPGQADGQHRLLAVEQVAASAGKQQAGWWLVLLEQRSAQAKLEQLLAAEQWEAAMMLATSHALDTDLIHKASWSRQPVGQQSLFVYWRAIADRPWAVQDCLTRAEATADAQSLLLQAGLQETDVQLAALEPAGQQEDNISWVEHSTDLQWRCLRLLLLQHTDRLATLLELHGGSYNASAFADFRESSLTDIACSMAAMSELDSLATLLQRHPYSLAPRLLEILGHLPETMSPTQFLPILTQACHSEAPEPLRQQDDVESPATCKQLKSDGQYALLVATEPMARLSIGWQPPTPAKVADWFEERAKLVDAILGQLSLVVDILDAGCEFAGEASERLLALKACAEELQAVTSAGASSGNEWAVPLEEYAALDTTGRMRLLLRDSGAGSMHGDRARLAALLTRLPPEERGPQLAVLLTQLANTQMSWCCELIRLEATAMQVIGSVTDLAEAVLACVYAYDGLRGWDMLASMLASSISLLQASSKGAPGGAPGLSGKDGWVDGWEEDWEADPKVQHLTQQVQQAQKLVIGAELLADLGLPSPIADLQTANTEQALRMVRTLLARLSRSQPPLPDSRWTDAWRELRALQETVWPFLSKQDLLAELCGSLLRCGAWRLAHSYLTSSGSTPLPLELAERIVISAGRDYFYSASTLDAPEILQAQQCLAVLPDSVGARAELDSIAAILRLREFGVEILPMQFQQITDRMEILQTALDARPGAYTNHAALTSLAAQLGLSKRASELQSRMAAAALREGDLEAAQAGCVALVRDGYAPAWELAAQLAVLNAATGDGSGKVKRELLAFALAHCTPSQFDDLARLWHMASWQPSMPARTPSDLILGSLQPAKPSLLPEYGDAPVAFDAVLSCKENAWSTLQQGLEEAEEEEDYCLTHRLLLLGIFAASFKALLPAACPEGDGNAAKAAAEAEQRLQLSAWQVYDQAQAAQGELHPDMLQAKQAAHAFCQRLADAADEHRMEALLPAAGLAASNGDGAPIGVDREAVLLQVATAAGSMGPGSEGEAKLRQALGLAERYKVDTWKLRLSYLQALLTQSLATADAAAPLAMSLLTQVLQLPQATQSVLDALLGTVYPSLVPTQHGYCALCLKLIAKCLETGQDNLAAGLPALQAAVAFAEECDTVAPELNARLIIDPLVAAATGATFPGSRSPKIRAAQMERELAAQVTHENVAHLADMVLRLRQAGLHAGVALDWPRPTFVYRQMFCKGLEDIVSAEDAERSFASVRSYLGHMEPDDILHTVKQVAERRASPGPIGQAHSPISLWPRALRLQALHDGMAALRASALPEADHLLPQLAALETAVAQVDGVQQSCALTAEQQDALEAELLVVGGGRQAASAGLQLLLSLGVYFGKVQSAAQSLMDPSSGDTEGGESSPSSGAAVTLEAVKEATQRALRQIAGPATTSGEESKLALQPSEAAESAQYLQGIVSSLEDATGEHADAARNVVWELLLDFVAGHENAAASDAGMQVVELLSSLMTHDDKLSRWADWAPTAQNGSSPVAVAVWSRSLALLGGKWPHTRLRPADFASIGAAEAAFLHLLEQASAPEQLTLLGKLLAEVWHDGAAFCDESTTSRLNGSEVTRQPAHQEAASADAHDRLIKDAPARKSAAEDTEDGWDLGFEVLAEIHPPERQAEAASSQPLEELPQVGHAGVYETAEEMQGWGGEGWDEEQVDLDLPSQYHSQEASLLQAAPCKIAPSPKAGPDDQRPDPKQLLRLDGTAGGQSGEGWEGEELELDFAATAKSANECGRGDEGSVDGWEGDHLGLELPGVQEAGSILNTAGQLAETKGTPLVKQATSPGSLSEASHIEAASKLHRCWAALLELQLREGAAQDALRMLDGATCSLVTAQEAAELVQHAAVAGRTTGITLALLLRYDDVNDRAIQQLVAAEPANPLRPDHSLLLVLLARGLFPILATASCFSDVCRLLLAQSPGQSSSRSSTLALNSWRGLLMPSAAAALYLNGSWAIASGLVARHLGLHPALVSIESGLLLLPRFFKGHMRLHRESPQPPWNPQDAPLPQTAVAVWRALPDLCQRAMAMLEQS